MSEEEPFSAIVQVITGGPPGPGPGTPGPWARHKGLLAYGSSWAYRAKSCYWSSAY